MKLLKSINLMENKKLIIWLNVFSLLLLILFLPIFILIASMDSKPLLTLDFKNGLELILWGSSFFGIIIIHELIHGFFFKVFHPQGKVKFGFKNGMAYATSPHSFYSKPSFFIIGIAPFILITTGLVIMLFAGIIPPIFFISLASLHASSCVGDFYWVYLLCQAPKNSLVEDTEVGINFYTSETD